MQKAESRPIHHHRLSRHFTEPDGRCPKKMGVSESAIVTSDLCAFGGGDFGGVA
ncbi:uncharacterized protein TrAFT101_008569 [Trichoderma asperellum]|uniref:uncharacterized protein n=1 Tax=Trichoderma asperellum TaxID=101201 RepID=UPI0033190832|nr:hypothetical protein TrAFT101_008569 [Trichoderma asperellum]